MKNQLKSITLKTVGLLFLILGPCVGAMAQSSGSNSPYASHPGYINIAENLDLSEIEVNVEINLRANMLRIVSAAARSENPEFADAIKDVQLIQVRVFETNDEQFPQLKAGFDRMNGKMSAANWEPMVRVREEGEDVSIFVLPAEDPNKIEGLAILVLDSTDGVIINIVGNFDMAAIAALGDGLNLDGLDELGNITESGG